MFEELYRKSGTLRYAAGYTDSRPDYTDYPCVYFTMAGSSRDEFGALQSETKVYCKPAGAAFPENGTPAVFVDESGAALDVQKGDYVYNHFDDCFEVLIVTVAA